MNQLSLFTPHNGTATSKAGAIAAAPRAGTQAELILAAIRNSSGMTNNEIAIRTGYPINVVTARVATLRDRYGLIRDSGETRKSEAGVPNKIWRAV